MNEPDKLIYCQKCLGFVPHEVVHDDYVECCSCGDRKKLEDPGVIEAERVTQGDPRRV